MVVSGNEWYFLPLDIYNGTSHNTPRVTNQPRKMFSQLQKQLLTNRFTLPRNHSQTIKHLLQAYSKNTLKHSRTLWNPLLLCKETLQTRLESTLVFQKQQKMLYANQTNRLVRFKMFKTRQRQQQSMLPVRISKPSTRMLRLLLNSTKV